MIQGLLGLTWNEVKLDLERVGRPYTIQISLPHGKMEAWGSCRVIRVREDGDRVEIVLAHEKFSPCQP